MNRTTRTLISLSSLLLIFVLLVGSFTMGLSFEELHFPEIRFGAENGGDAEQNTYTLQVTAGDGGRVNTAGGEYPAGEEVSLSATPDDGYVFNGWFDAHGSYLSISPDYTVTVVKNTRVQATFAKAPKDMTAKSTSEETFSGCTPDFSFTLRCDRPDAEDYIRKNLIITDPYLAALLGKAETDDTVKVPYRVESTGNGTYRITPKEAYTAGTQYKAALMGGEDAQEISFAGKGEALREIGFTVRTEEESRVASYRDGILYLEEDDILFLTDDGLSEGDAGDRPDGITVRDLSFLDGIRTDDPENPLILCIRGAGAEGEDYYGAYRATERRDNGTYFVTLATPPLSALFSQLSLSVRRDGSDFLSDSPNAETVLYGSPVFRTFAAAVYDGMAAVAKENGYEAAPLTGLALSDLFVLMSDIRTVGKDCFLTLSGSMELPPVTQGTGSVYQVRISFRLEKKISFALDASVGIAYQSRLAGGAAQYAFDLTVSDSEDFSFSADICPLREDVSLPEDTAARCAERIASLFTAYRNGTRTPLSADAVSEMFRAAGYRTEDDRITLEFLNGTVQNGPLRLSLRAALHLEFAPGEVSLLAYHAERHTHVSLTPSGMTRDFRTQTETAAVAAAGSSLFVSSVEADLDVRFVGLSKYVGFALHMNEGSRMAASGFVFLKKESANAPIGAGTLESSHFLTVSADCRMFSHRQQSERNFVTEPVCYGARTALIAWETETPTVGILPGRDGLPLASSPLFRVRTLKTETMERALALLGSLPENCRLTITTGQGSHLIADGTTLRVADDAPAVFRETVTITVRSEEIWGEGGTVSYLPPLTVSVVCGDEDAYYAATDTQMESYFRGLYRSLNASTVRVLEESLRDILNILPDSMPKEFRTVAENLLTSYLHNLFTAAERAKAEATGTEGENRFVREEAEAMEAAMQVFLNVTKDDNYRPTQADVETMISSRVLRDTLQEIADAPEKWSALQEHFSAMSDPMRASLDTAMRDLLSANETSPSYGEFAEICDLLRTLFGIGNK